jgi:hypothetical protein
MSTETIVFEDFRSSKKRQQRITQIAVCVGSLFAFFLLLKFFSLEKQVELLPGTVAKINEVEGKLLIKRGADTVAYQPGFIVLAGDMFQTIGDSTVSISYVDDGTKVTLGPDTTLLFNGNAGGKRTNLSAGTARFVIPKQPNDLPMVLASYNADAAVLASGTITQSYSGLATHFTVDSGHIRIRRYSDGRVTDVRAGESHECKPDNMGVIKFDPSGLE